MKSIFKSVLPLVCLVAAIPTLPAGQVRDTVQKQGIALLQRVDESANDVLTTVERLDSYNHSPNEYSRELHLSQLEALKDQINSMTRDLDKLAASRSGLDTADRRAVERVLIAAVELAQSANMAIMKASRAETSPALNVEYRKLVADCYREASSLVKALDAGIVELK